jgi:hypothetical protein
MIRHRLAHVALTLVYLATAGILFMEGAIAHAVCAAVVALIYAYMAIETRRTSDLS